MVESDKRAEIRETLLELLADSVGRYHRALSLGNQQFIAIHASVAESLYWGANEAGIPTIETAKVFIAASPVQNRNKVLTVLTSRNMLSHRDARRIEKLFMISPSPASSPVHKT